MKSEHREDINAFVKALTDFVGAQLHLSPESADYNPDSIQVVDARNHLFRNVGKKGTDEENDIYAIRSLCRIDEETLDIIPDSGRAESVARNYF